MAIASRTPAITRTRRTSTKVKPLRLIEGGYCRRGAASNTPQGQVLEGLVRGVTREVSLARHALISDNRNVVAEVIPPNSVASMGVISTRLKTAGGWIEKLASTSPALQADFSIEPTRTPSS